MVPSDSEPRVPLPWTNSVQPVAAPNGFDVKTPLSHVVVASARPSIGAATATSPAAARTPARTEKRNVLDVRRRAAFPPTTVPPRLSRYRTRWHGSLERVGAISKFCSGGLDA